MAIPRQGGQFVPGIGDMPMSVAGVAVGGQHLGGPRSAQLALEALPVAVALVEPRGRLIGLNEAMRQITSQPVDMHATRFAQLWREDAWDVDAMLKTVMRARVWSDCALTSIATGQVVRFKAQALCTEPERISPNLLIFMHNCPRSGLPGEQPEARTLKRQMRQAERERTRLEGALARETERRRELVHRIKNNLSILVSLVRMARSRQASSGSDCALTTFEHRVHAMAAAYNILDSEQRHGVCRLDEMLTELCTSLQHAVGGERVQLVPALEPVVVDLDAAISISLMVNELVTNAVKHAFPAARSGQIMVTLERRAHIARLRVADDGVGCGQTRQGDAHLGQSRRGSGGRIVQSLARKLQGEVTTGPYREGAATRPGHVCQIDVPLPEGYELHDVS